MVITIPALAIDHLTDFKERLFAQASNIFVPNYGKPSQPKFWFKQRVADKYGQGRELGILNDHH